MQGSKFKLSITVDRLLPFNELSSTKVVTTREWTRTSFLPDVRPTLAQRSWQSQKDNPTVIREYFNLLAQQGLLRRYSPGFR